MDKKEITAIICESCKRFISEQQLKNAYKIDEPFKGYICESCVQKSTELSNTYREKKLHNEHAQPIRHSIKDSARLDERKVDEMIGICKGIISDKEINKQEVDFLSQWLANNVGIANSWPANILYQRIDKILKDNILDQDEKKELFDILRQITGERTGKDAKNMATRLPLTEPPPTVTFKNQNYCFTGHFATGTRTQVESIVIEKGGNVQKIPTLDTNYLVIGLMSSTDWIHSTYGRKIERAVEIQDECAIKIISEEYWTQFI